MRPVVAVLSVLLIASAPRAESELGGAVVDHRAALEANVAAGRNAGAQAGSIRRRDSRLPGTAVSSVRGALLLNVSAGTGAKARLGSVDMENSRYRGRIVNVVLGSAVNVAAGSGSQANSSSVVMRNAGGGGRIFNGSGFGVVVNSVEAPFSRASGRNVNIAAKGRTSNKNSVVFK